MTTLITGISGLLGRYLVGCAPESEDLDGISRGAYPPELDAAASVHEFDLEDPTGFEELITQIRPHTIIHAAAEGRVDVVEGHADAFHCLNVGVPTHLARVARRHDIKFVFISSNAVFGGSRIPYDDNSRLTPINDYGRLKAEAETLVLKANSESLIVRPLLMYGWPFPNRRANPVVHWLRKLRSGKSIDVVDDVWTQPLYAGDCAKVVWEGVLRDSVGTMNVSGGVSMSLAETALAVCDVFALDHSLVRAVGSDAFPGIAPRPAQTAFTLDRVLNEIGIRPAPPKDGLRLLRDSRFRYVRTPSNSNLPARAPNVGIELAKGKYIAFLDHDDIWRPRKLEREIQVLETYPDVALVHSHLWDFTPRSKFVGLVLLPNPYRRRGSYQVLRRHNVVQCSSAMVRSEVLRNMAGFDERPELRAVEDYHLWMRIAKEHTIAYVSEVHGDYRWLQSGTSRQGNLEDKHRTLDQVASAMIIESAPSAYRRVARKLARYPLAIYFHLVEGPLRQLVGASPRVWIARNIDAR